MDVGMIATRYARAIYEYAAEKKEETTIYGEIQLLIRNFLEYPVLRKVMNDPTVSSKHCCSPALKLAQSPIKKLLLALTPTANFLEQSQY